MLICTKTYSISNQIIALMTRKTQTNNFTSENLNPTDISIPNVKLSLEKIQDVISDIHFNQINSNKLQFIPNIHKFISILNNCLHFLLSLTNDEILTTNNNDIIMNYLNSINYYIQLFEMDYLWDHSYGYSNIWIVKPVGLSCGREISVVSNIVDILNRMKLLNYKCIIQKYIDKPRLI